MEGRGFQRCCDDAGRGDDDFGCEVSVGGVKFGWDWYCVGSRNGMVIQREEIGCT